MDKMERAELKSLVREILEEELQTIPIGISNRHVHLTEGDFQQLFPGDSLRVLKPLKQPGEFAAEQTVSLIGPKGQRKNVRILGPLRKQSQVEISKTDGRTLGIDAPIRLSGDLADAKEITLQSQHGQLIIPAAIVAKRHIHMSISDMKKRGLQAGEEVAVKIDTPERATIFENVVIRPGENFLSEMHLDTDEANAAGVTANTRATIVKR